MSWYGMPWIPAGAGNRWFSKCRHSDRQVEPTTTGAAASLMRGDPGAAFRRLEAGEHAYIAGDQKPQGVDRMPDPADIGHDRHPLPLRNVLKPDPEVFPRGAGEAAADLVIEPDLVVPLQRAFHQWFQNLVAVFVGHPPLGDDPHDVIREPLDKLNHRSLLWSASRCT